MKKEKVGSIYISDTIDITDPSYKRKLGKRDAKDPDKPLYRINDAKAVPGEYDCCVWRKEESYEGDHYFVNSRIAVYKDGVIPDWKDMTDLNALMEADCGTDTCLAGFFPGKPDYTDEEWQRVCNTELTDTSKYAWITDDGFFAETGQSDGEIGVYAHLLDDGRADAFVIIGA